MIIKWPKRKKLSKRKEAKCNEINLLFDAVVNERDIREAEIFRHCYPDNWREVLGKFLRDVSACPEEVIKYCREILVIASKAKELKTST